MRAAPLRSAQRRRWSSGLALFGLGLAGLLAIGGARAGVVAVGMPKPPSGAQRLLLKFECNRCHDGTGLPAAPRDKHCVSCHQDILQGKFEAPPEVLKKWQGNLHSLLYVPSLEHLGERLKRSWVEQFLLHPHDLRPGLVASMPRLRMTPWEAHSLATALVPEERLEVAAIPSSPELVARGQALLGQKGCGTCHRFTQGAPLVASPIPVPVPPEQLKMALALAPDLSHTRARFQPAALRGFILDPQAVKPGSPMPTLPLTTDEADALVAYLLYAPLDKAKATPTPVPPRLPVLGRRVSWDEVSEKVFKKVCWHCHSTPELALGDGGPGNTGGFGFPGRGLNVAGYSDIMAGSLDDKGERRSVFLPIDPSAKNDPKSDAKNATPRLVAHLLARQSEVAGKPVPGILGMPLGLPPMSPEQIQLVESWIAQGRPR